MVIAHDIHKWFEDRRKKRLAKAREEGLKKAWLEAKQEGRIEERKLWQEWNSRRMEAKALGEEFLEPPPSGKIQQMVQITTHLPDELAESLDAAAARLQRSQAYLIRQALERYLEKLDDPILSPERLRDPSDPALD